MGRGIFLERENFKDKTILFSITGQVIYFETEDLINSETPKEFTIQTNLADDITLKDALIFDNKIFVSITYRRKSCDSIDLFVANFNLKKLEFEEFYSQNKKGECKGWLKAGRLAKYLDNGENSILLMVATGFTASVAFILIFSAYRIASPAVVSPFEYSILIWSSLSGWFFFNETLDLKTLIGMFLIVSGGIYIFIREKAQDQSIVTEKPLR